MQTGGINLRLPYHQLVEVKRKTDRRRRRSSGIPFREFSDEFPTQRDFSEIPQNKRTSLPVCLLMHSFHTKYFASPQVKRKDGPLGKFEKIAHPLRHEHSKVTIHSLDPNKSNSDHKLIVKETGKTPTPPPYLLDVRLGAGVFSEVFSAVTKDGTPFALKRISKVNPKFNWRMVLREINAGKKLSHKNIIRFKDHFETSSNVYLVMECFEGKDIYSLMEMRDFQPFDERLARHIFIQVVKALEYCHSKGICHRDVKLENLLLNEAGMVKLIDFGLCGSTGNGLLTDFVGTADYAAPEVLSREPYDGALADTWSAGVVLYALLTGEFPFDIEEMLHCLGNTPPSLPLLSWPVTPSLCCKGIVEGLLQELPSRRMSLKEARKLLKKNKLPSASLSSFPALSSLLPLPEESPSPPAARAPEIPRISEVALTQ